MMRRLYHALWAGHSWTRTRAVSFKGDGCMRYGFGEEIRQQIYGFTDVYESCVCGARRRTRQTGSTEGAVDGDAELAQLRRMSGL